jgi:hypothetical protein
MRGLRDRFSDKFHHTAKMSSLVNGKAQSGCFEKLIRKQMMIVKDLQQQT